MIGQTISHYKILEKLGEGGMGVVYKAQDTKLDRLVALKFLPPEYTRDPDAKQRFIHEAKSASALDHPNICTIYEVDETSDGQLFIAMAYYEGETLQQKIKPAGAIHESPLSLDVAISYANQTAEGLQAAHKKGITHRDIKSSNIMVTTENQVKIMDFGLAKTTAATMLTKTGSTIGTVPYMSPEQARGEKMDHRTDIWSLGVVLYEMISGRLPFQSPYSEAIVYSILNEEAKPFALVRNDVPGVVERIVKRCLQKNLADRYQHADELIVDLRQARAGVGKEAPREKAPKPTKFQWRNWYLVGGAALAIGILLLVFLPRFTTTNEAIHSIAVLPLENLSGDPEQEYFADGMTEALITDLAKISSIRVISRTSVSHFKATKKTIPEIAKELNVDAIVEGSVQRSGDRVRITAQLLHAPTDRHLWAESYERNMTDVLALQSELALAIVKEIHAKLTPQEETHIASAPAVNKEAYELYLKGLYFWNKRTEEGMWKAIEYFDQAIEKDPNSAHAYAGLAESYFLLRIQEATLGGTPPKDSYPKSKAAALKAVEIDETLSEGHTALAVVKRYYDRDDIGSEREFKRAIELNPSDANAHRSYAISLVAMGRMSEALVEIKRAQELDPLSLGINSALGWVLYFARQYDQSIEQLKKTLEMDPNFALAHFRLGLAYQQKERHEEAIAAFHKAVTLSGGGPLAISALGHAYAVSGRKNEAQKVLAELHELAKQRYVEPFYVAAIYTGLSDKDQAFAWLEKAYVERSESLFRLNVDPRFDSLRADPRFSELLKKIGLPAGETSHQTDAGAVVGVNKEGTSIKWQNSIAVLPFKNISSDKEQEYFCDGMTEQLITNLTNLPNVKVIARTSVMQFKNSGKTIQQIANELGVAHVLEGSVRKAGNKIRVTAQLIKADDGFHLWAKDYDRQLKDIFAVQDDVSNAIVEGLKINLTSAQKSTITRRYTENVEAYQLYLKGRYHWYKRSEEGYKKSIEYFDEAIRLDRKYALAYSGLADAYNLLAYYGFLPPKEAFPKAKEAAMRALELDETVPEAHASLQFIKTNFDWDWTGAEREFKRAIELDQNYVEARHWYAYNLSRVKRHEEAIAEIKRAQQIDPLSLPVNRSVGKILYVAGQYDQSLEQLRKTIEMDKNFYPPHVDFYDVYQQQGLYENAVKEYLEAMTLRGENADKIVALREAYKLAGWHGFCRKNLEFAVESSKKGYVPPNRIAAWYVRLGEKDSAFVWLQKAFEERSPSMTWLKVEPIWDSLRSDLRFIELLKKVGLEK